MSTQTATQEGSPGNRKSKGYGICSTRGFGQTTDAFPRGNQKNPKGVVGVGEGGVKYQGEKGTYPHRANGVTVKKKKGANGGTKNYRRNLEYQGSPPKQTQKGEGHRVG